MSKIIVTMPAYIQKDYPAAARQLVWHPTSLRRYTFLQLGWSGGKRAKFYKYSPNDATSGPSPLFVVR